MPNLAKVEDVSFMEGARMKRKQVTCGQQIRSLMKKNLKIHMRTNACPCCPCCGPGQCIPVVIFSGCVVHMCFPIFFVFMVTAVPYLMIGFTMNEKDRKEFLDVQVEPPVFPKQYPGWPKHFYEERETGRSMAELYGIWDSREPFNMDGGEFSWTRAPPVGVRPILDNLFLPPNFKGNSGGWSEDGDAPSQYSCWCKTLGLVGPAATVNEFKTFLQTHYDAWQAGLNATNAKIKQFEAERATLWSLADKRRLASEQNRSGAADPSNMETWKASTSASGHPFSVLQDLMDPFLDRPTRGKMRKMFDTVWSSTTLGRRLQRGGKGTDEEGKGAASERAWASCDVNAGAYQGPIWRTFGSSDDIDEYVKDSDYGDYEKDRTKTSTKDRLCGAIIFENDVRTAGVPEYTIRMNVTGHSNQGKSGVDGSLTEEHENPENIDWKGSYYFYWNSGFLAIQHLMHHFLYETHSPSGNKELLQHEPFFGWLPSGERNEWQFGGVVGGILGLPLTMTLQFGPVVASIAYYVARERMTRQRELMRMMGLSDCALMWSWVLMFVLMNVIVTMFMMVLFMAFLFQQSDWFLWWIILFLFACALSTFGMSMAAFVSTDKWSALGAIGMFFGLSWTFIAVGDYASTAVKLLAGLVPSNGFMLTATTFWQLETWQIGATFGSADTDRHGFSVSLGVFWLFLDFWFWLFIYYYFDQIVPWHGVGVPRRPWFCCLGAYWREVSGKPPLVGEATAVEDRGNAMTKPEYIEKEDDPHLLQMVQNNQTVEINNLTKHFANAAGQKIKAVDGLSFKMYQDECFCLLGHNGAGKTTTMMMLTGCMPQSSGDIKVKGFRIPEQIRTVRSSMGFCPQHNVLWDELTVFEHLELFGNLGGMAYPDLCARGDQLLMAVALLDKKHERAAALSGGMKRKLSAALAFLAEPFMVILDEPSSGMDPYARRGMWDTLKRWRSGHIICLTTHYMDEADALGDRIAIMANGRLACAGTPNFLKRTFGCGYVISFAKTSSGNERDGAIVQAVKDKVGPHVEIMSAAGRELLVQVPFASAVYFPVLFQAIDEQKGALGIESYGTSVTNLEEVFLKVAHHDASHAKDVEEGAESKLLGGGQVRLSAGAEFRNQLWALLVRRVRFGLRDKTSSCFELITPTVCLLVAIMLMSMAMVFTLPKLELNTVEWNKDVEVSPKVPISLGVVSGSPYSSIPDLVDLWQGRDRMDIIAKTDLPDPGASSGCAAGGFCHTSCMSLAYCNDPSSRDAACNNKSAKCAWDCMQCMPGSLVAGILEETEFVKYAYPQPAAEASQYGAILYPKNSAWCPGATPGLTIFANLTAHHALPVLFNAHGEVALAKSTKNSATPITKIKVSNHPMDKTEFEQSRMVRVSGILAAVMIMAAYGFIPATVTFYIVMEKEKEVKNQLIISGCGQFAYWTANFIYDVLWGVLPVVSAMIIFQAYGMTAFIERPGLAASIAIFFIFLPAMTGMAYLFSFLFSKAGNALIFSWIFNLSIGFLGSIIIGILLEIEDTYEIGIFVRWVFRFIPIFSLGYAFISISAKQMVAKAKGVGALTGLGVGGTWCVDPNLPRFKLYKYRENRECTYMVGDEFLIMVICAVLYFALTCVFDIVLGLPVVKKFLQSCCGANKIYFPQVPQLKDAMVVEEEQRLDTIDPAEQFVYVRDLHKMYPNRTYAVRGISFACSDGQVFGLLGVNGAGKTSTFKILCGQVEQTQGQVLIKGINVSTHAPEARRLIGYCPQFDALLECMTTKEHLQLYGRIKGLSGRQLQVNVDSQLRELDLMQYVHSRAGRLSGGNKRKLSVAMATIAEPPMVFLDEPSAGMDPVARRGMWSLIQNIAEKRKKAVVILTTHSMEEAEALCSRIAIQVDGQFRCLGTSQQIKSRYGQGLELNVRLATPTMEEIIASATKLGGNLGDLVDVQTAAQRVTTHYGDQVTAHLAVRPGSPLADKAPVALGMLAEWVLLQERTNNFEAFLMKELSPETGGVPCANVLEKSQNVARYQIVPEALRGRFQSLGSLFKLFQDNQAQLLIDDFQVCQASLEQIFNRFAATQMAAAAQAAAAQAAAQQTQQQAQAAAQAAPAATEGNENGKPADNVPATTTVVVAPVAATENNKANVAPVQLGKAVDENV